MRPLVRGAWFLGTGSVAATTNPSTSLAERQIVELKTLTRSPSFPIILSHAWRGNNNWEGSLSPMCMDAPPRVSPTVFAHSFALVCKMQHCAHVR